MKLFYGWVIAAVGIVVGCVGMGGLMSFGVFLQPMAETLGWSRAGISSGSTLAFLWMGVGGFLWGQMFDRYGARVVVLLGGLLQGIGLIVASQAQSLPVFLGAYDTVVGLAVGAIYVPLTAATASWFTRPQPCGVSRLDRSGTGHDADSATRAVADHHARLAFCHAHPRRHRLGRDPARCAAATPGTCNQSWTGDRLIRYRSGEG